MFYVVLFLIVSPICNIIYKDINLLKYHDTSDYMLQNLVIIKMKKELQWCK